jgi:hypothetical protein
MKNMSKMGYVLMSVLSQASFAVTDEYLNQMSALEAQWNEYAPASEKDLELEKFIALVDGIGENFAIEKLTAANRVKNINYHSLHLTKNEDLLRQIKANAKIPGENFCPAAIAAERSRLSLIILYSQEIAYLSDLDVRFMNQDSLGLMNVDKFNTKNSYLERAVKITQAIEAQKALASEKNTEYQNNHLLTCREILADIAQQIAQQNTWNVAKIAQ